MPERPKRRKNNKNKRKNKSNQQPGNKQKSELSEPESTEAPSIERDTTPKDSSKSNVNDFSNHGNIISSLTQTTEAPNTATFPDDNQVLNYDTEIKLTSETICNVMQSLMNEDLNNNNNDVKKIEEVTTEKKNENCENIRALDTLPSTSENNCTAERNIENDLNTNNNRLDVEKTNALKVVHGDIDAIESLSYVVETPENPINNKRKICSSLKSKSLDNDDDPKIVEITDSGLGPSEEDNTLPIVESSDVLVSDVDSDIEWENTNELKNSHNMEIKEIATGTLSVTTIPLNVAQCEHTKSLTPDEEISLRKYLKTLNLSTEPENMNSVELKSEIEHIINREIKHRLRKKGLAEDFIIHRLGPPRVLDVIDEEGSSGSSMTSRRQSYLSDKKSDNDDLEDDVFEDPTKSKDLKFYTKSINLTQKSFGRLLPQQCLLLGTKIKEPEIAEARGDWTVKTIEKMTGAELVYLTDSSSSTSSVNELFEETDEGVDTDVSVRMITPTIEVTDTESLLKNTFISKNNDKPKEEEMRSQESHVDNKSIQFDNIEKTEIENSFIDNTKENSHEIVVLSTDNIKTDLYVKELDAIELKNHCNLDEAQTSLNINSNNNEYALEIKVLKCELNDAINNLIKEVSSDSEIPNETYKDTFTRQDSSSSVCSSQCTAKYNPTSSSLNDVSNIMHDESENNKEAVTNTTISHVKDVIEHVTGPSAQSDIEIYVKQPLTLRDSCVKRIAKFPYGNKILEELASVSNRLQNITLHGARLDSPTKNIAKKDIPVDKMPYYPVPVLSTIDKICLTTRQNVAPELPPPPVPPPPPVMPRNSSLKKSHEEEHRTALPTKTEPVYVCLSPSQKMLMEKTHTILTKEDASRLVDMHTKYVDRRGYNEYYKNKDKKENSDDIKPLTELPFKSQTGSRLLALIRDPNFTGNVKSLKNNSHSYSSDNFERKLSIPESSFQRSTDRHGSLNNSCHTFKPIPPPRPKKLSSSLHESDETSGNENSFRSMKNERKYFHFSTGSLSKEIENDVSSIQNMHRFYTNVRDRLNGDNCPRRPSLPKDLCDQQMEYICQKEKEVSAEIQRLEESNKLLISQRRGPKAPLISKKEEIDVKFKNTNRDNKSHKQDIIFPNYTDNNLSREKGKLSSLFSSSQEEIHREKMYSEYVSQMAEREERKQHKVIKITNPNATSSHQKVSKSFSALDILDSKVNNRIEKEFISKARERWYKLGIKDPETEDERDSGKDVYREPKVIEHKIKVIEGDEETDVQKLPSHLQEFVRFTAKEKEQGSSTAVWRPGAPTPPPAPSGARSPGAPPPPPPPPVWTPGSAGASPLTPRKSFRPVHFEETPPPRQKFGSSEQNGCTSGSESEGRLRTSHSAPATGLNSLGGSSSTSRLPRAQNPTVTLLQKAREGQIPRGSPNYIQLERDAARLPRDRPSPPRGDPVHALRQEYASEGEDRSDYERAGARKMADAHRKVEGIGPTTKEGMPVTLRSEVKDPSKWYKKMYDTIHKNKYDDDYVTIRYKSRRGEPQRVTPNKSHYAYFDPRSGYLSEPEGGLSRLGSSTWSDAYDSDVTTGPRRRTASVQEERRVSEMTTPYMPSNKYSTLASARASQEVYKGQPGRIENYMPGKSSVVDKEAKQWWDEVMDIFDGWLDDNSPLPPYTTLLARAIQKSQNISSTTSLPQASPKEKKDLTSTILSKSNMARALKESGYESDSTLVFRRREETEAPLSPLERRAAYRELQAGGEPPLRGFRSPAPPRQETDPAPEPPRRTSHGSYSDTESPRRYVESDVNIHYRCPVRHDPLPLVPERELARQQAEHMKRLYREQRRNKYLQENDIQAADIEAFDASMKELQDMQNRRHQDNFTPSQKTVVPLNRYDEAERVVARSLYAFNGQTPRELSFRKGDLINVRRQIDANWYEGEIHGRVGLFPYNYVEIQKGDVVQPTKKPVTVEGRARAKFDFTAQTNLELPLKKGEVVVLTRRIDQNWWEGRNGVKTGIFPDSYVTILQEPSQNKPEAQPITSTDKPVASPAAHGLLNGSAKRSMGSHSYTPQPNSPALSNAPPATQPLPGYAKQAPVRLTPSERGYGPPTGQGVDLNNTEPLYVDTNAEAIPFRAMYKYRPQNPDELELNEGDTVYVLEKCDDGWYVGSSQRTGRFGTFPGNYVERI